MAELGRLGIGRPPSLGQSQCCRIETYLILISQEAMCFSSTCVAPGMEFCREASCTSRVSVCEFGFIYFKTGVQSSGDGWFWRSSLFSCCCLKTQGKPGLTNAAMLTHRQEAILIRQETMCFSSSCAAPGMDLCREASCSSRVGVRDSLHLFQDWCSVKRRWVALVLQPLQLLWPQNTMDTRVNNSCYVD